MEVTGMRLKLMLTTATVMDVAMEVTGVLTDSLLTVATDALTEDTEATDVATTARGRLRLRPIPTMALTDTVDFLTEAMDVLTVFLLMVVMVALTEDTAATGVATTARGRLRLLSDTAMAASMEDMVGTGLMAAMAALTGMATESRQ